MPIVGFVVYRKIKPTLYAVGTYIVFVKPSQTKWILWFVNKSDSYISDYLQFYFI